MFKTSTMNHNLFKIWSKEDKKQQKHLKNLRSEPVMRSRTFMTRSR